MTTEEIIKMASYSTRENLEAILSNALKKGLKIGRLLDGAPDLMKQSTAARYLDTSPATISQWVKNGVISRVYVNGSPRISKEEILRLLVKREITK